MDEAPLDRLRRDDEMQRAALKYEQEIQAMRSDTKAMWARMIDLLDKVHTIDPYGSKSFDYNSKSTEVRTQSLTNTGLNDHWQRAGWSSASSW